jgi:hypothetical protein
MNAHDVVAALRCRDVINTGDVRVYQYPELSQAQVVYKGHILARVNYYKGQIELDDCGQDVRKLLTDIASLATNQGDKPWAGKCTLRLVL